MDVRIEKGTIDTRTEDVLVRLVTAEDAKIVDNFKGKLGEVHIAPAPTGSGAQFILTVGLGAMEAVDREVVREATGAAIAAARSLKAASMALVFPTVSAFTAAEIGQVIAEAAMLTSYAYDVFKKQPDSKTRLKKMVWVVDDKATESAAKKGVVHAVQLMAGVTLARDLVNAPAEHMHPTELATVAKRIAKESNGRIKVKILDRAACEKLGMGAYLAVAKGSDYPPQFIHLTYTPAKKSSRSLAIVGKGITFDSGGLSIKPADGMMTMKCDMAGAAAVLGLFESLSALAPSVTVHGIIAAAENMPSGKAMRPGDIARASNGMTIEILNTDAEGRLTLADALTYAVKLKPDAIIDLATLTGACVVALGEEIAGLMSNDEDVTVALLAASERAGEKFWEMPLPPRYKSLIESDVADLRNIATSRYGGSLTAGLFLQEFVDETPWAHLDIAGPAFAERPMSSYLGKGGTGFAVRTLAEFVETF